MENEVEYTFNEEVEGRKEILIKSLLDKLYDNKPIPSNVLCPHKSTAPNRRAARCEYPPSKKYQSSVPSACSMDFIQRVNTDYYFIGKKCGCYFKVML